MGKRSRKRRARRAWMVSLAMPWIHWATARVQKARPRTAYRWGLWLGTLFRWVGFSRETVARNLELATGRTLAKAERKAFERRYYEHLGLMLVEFLRQPTFTADGLEDLVGAEGLKTIRDVYAEDGAGTIFVAGHAGLWELAGHAAGLAGCTILSVAKLSGHPGLDGWVTSLREASGKQTIRDVAGSMWGMKKALDRGEAVGINVDQEARKGQVFAPFFGILAATSNTPALLHLKTQAPIVVATVHRVGPFRYELKVYDVIRHEPTGDRDADTLAITTRINAAMEAMIRDHPEQWLWSHRRWRRRPPGVPEDQFDRAPGAKLLEV